MAKDKNTQEISDNREFESAKPAADLHAVGAQVAEMLNTKGFHSSIEDLKAILAPLDLGTDGESAQQLAVIRNLGSVEDDDVQIYANTLFKMYWKERQAEPISMEEYLGLVQREVGQASSMLLKFSTSVLNAFASYTAPRRDGGVAERRAVLQAAHVGKKLRTAIMKAVEDELGPLF